MDMSKTLIELHYSQTLDSSRGFNEKSKTLIELHYSQTVVDARLEH